LDLFEELGRKATAQEMNELDFSLSKDLEEAVPKIAYHLIQYDIIDRTTKVRNNTSCNGISTALGLYLAMELGNFSGSTYNAMFQHVNALQYF